MTNIMKTRFFTLATLALALAACNNGNDSQYGNVPFILSLIHI